MTPEKEQEYRGYLQTLIKTYLEHKGEKDVDVKIPGVPVDKPFMEWLSKQGPILAMFGLIPTNENPLDTVLKPIESLNDDPRNAIWVMEYHGQWEVYK